MRNKQIENLYVPQLLLPGYKNKHFSLKAGKQLLLKDNISIQTYKYIELKHKKTNIN